MTLPNVVVCSVTGIAVVTHTPRRRQSKQHGKTLPLPPGDVESIMDKNTDERIISFLVFLSETHRRAHLSWSPIYH
jgi:hypothetical protein